MKAAKALKEKGETPEELLRSIKENEAAAAEAQREVDAWKAIVGEKSRREEAAKAEAERIATEKAEAERKAAEERKTKEEERKERDENGQPFVVSSDGTTTFGEITEDTGLTAAPIKLSEGVADEKGNGYGLRHIEARHGDQIRKAGFSSVEEFVKYVASNYDKHNIKIGKKRANGVETYLIQAEDEHSNVLYVELSKDGSYWNVNSGGIFRKGYAEKKKDVGQNTEHPTSATTLQDKSFVQTDKDNGSQSADTHSDKQHPSADKGTTLPADQQTSDKENTKKVADSEGENTLKAKIEAASADVNTEPTEAQKEAGNYKKGHVQVGTFDITIEQPEGSIRRGTDADGKKWESKMHNTYGYFRGTEGVDGDHIDVFLSNDIDGWNGRKVFVVDQYNPDGTFDEHKVMLGFNDMDEAKSDYLANYEKGWENGRRITVSTTNLEDFEKWIDSSHRKTKPFSEYSSVNKETVANNPANDEANTDDNASEQKSTPVAEARMHEIRRKYADKLLAEFESALKEGVAPEQVKPEDVDRSVRENRSEKTELTAEERELRDNLVERMRKGGLDVVTDSEEMQRVIDTENEQTRNMFVGEKGATEADKAEEVSTRLDNLSVARRMEEAKKDAKYAKMDAEVEEASGVAVDEEDGELYRDGELERVNEEFNNRLSSLAANRNQKDRVLKLGRPSRFLIDGGVTDAEIILEFDKLARKSDDGYKNEHPFDVMDVENLPLAIAYPIAVFDNTNGYSSGKVILTELKKDGRNFIVVVQTISQRRKGGVVLEVNRIDTLFPKEERGIVNWFNKGLASNIDKEKALRFIKALPNHPGTITKEELLSATKEVKNFEFSKSSDVDRLVGALKDKTDFELYNRLAGEVEARNTEKRIGMTKEERRASLASETEDVAREDQILLRQGLDGIDIMRSEAAATPLKGDEALTALDSIFGENEGSAIPPKISSFAKFKNLFKKPVRTFLGELVQVKDEVWNKILRNNRQDITGTVLPTIENADFAIRDTDGSTLYVKRFKGDGQERMYNVVVVNKHGEVEDYISSVHIKRDNNLRNKIKKGAELFLPNARTTDGTMSRNNSTPGAKVANYSETAKPRFSRKPGESIFDYASRVSEDVDRSVRERVSALDEYEKKVKSKGFQTKKALQNSMLGLQEFMSAIDHASGNKRYIEDIPDFENPILGENRLSSVNKEESHSRLDAIHSPTPTKGVRKPYLRSYTMIYMPLADIFFPRMYQAPDGFMAVRITLMYYVDFYNLFNNPEKEWDIILSKAFDAPSEPSLFD